MNKIREKLAAGKVITMVNPDFQSPRLVEFLATFGFDVVFFDAERMSYDFERIEELTRAAHLAGIAAMARPWTNDPGLVTRYFDCGVDGIAIPHVEDAAGARKWVDVVRYARPRDHADKIVILMTETPAAIAKIGEIAAVPGVDVINIGVHDVALAAGQAGAPRSGKAGGPGDRAHPQGRQARRVERPRGLGAAHAGAARERGPLVQRPRADLPCARSQALRGAPHDAMTVM
jgi:2-keto-3-deoxy-L-rhamnonate aldolase RhmA